MPGRSLAAALVVAGVLAPSASAQVADSNGGGLRVAAKERAAHALDFAVPLRGVLESRFGYRWGRVHAGLDVAVLGSDRVRAALGGVVTKVGYQADYAGYGNVVVVRHASGLTMLYAHLASYGVRAGDPVARGEPIAQAGCTGSCTGQHLHFEVRIGGRPVNPWRYLDRTAYQGSPSR